MKRILLALALVLAAVPLAAAQRFQQKAEKASPAKASPAKVSRGPKGPAQNLVTISPSFQVNSTYGAVGTLIGYERALGDLGSVVGQILLQAGGYSGFATSTVGFAGSYRWHFFGASPLEGVFAGPKLGVQLLSASYDYYVGTVKRSSSSSTTQVRFGAEGGYQAKVYGDIFAGALFDLGYTTGTLSTTGVSVAGNDGFSLGSYATVGFAF